MGHLLSTMNEGAANAIDNPPALPDVGTMVVYIPRAGVMRMGRREFPALVLGGTVEEQTLELMVIMEPEDMMLESHVAFQMHNQPNHCWRHIRTEQSDQRTEAENARLNAMADRLTKIERQIWGEDYEASDVSLMAIMHEFEHRLAAKAGGKKGKKG